MKEARATMRRIGLELIEQRSAVLTNEQAVLSDSQMMSPINSLSDIIEGDKTVVGRDLLGILIRSNSASVPSQRLSREEILCQISTFLAAGHETTASALTWILYSLACAPDVQITLRTHLRNIPIPSSSACTPSPALLDAIERLPYLSYVVREGLRLHAPVTSTMRVATADDVIPVSSPFRDRRGRLCSAIHVRRGDIISVPIQAMNRSKAIWGEDAGVFRPERWAGTRDEKTRETAGSVDKRKEGRQHTGVQGLWGNILTFGNGNPVNGNRACIGYRFALSEIKIFLFVLVRDIEFSIDPSIEIEKKVNVVTRPCVKSEPHRGNQMPLYVRRVPPDDAPPHSSSTINL
ncbi:hypothetical protein A0H81_08616 [Grifola frondosa]|uniref:Cytochrome P450 n=1 Tax=Grifola frondosa TaxID=5627 RepID=A0A1C7M2X2_GRIFR|nr:hypothetical protein A0H81_08616 [Grifola frondosa]